MRQLSQLVKLARGGRAGKRDKRHGRGRGGLHHRGLAVVLVERREEVGDTLVLLEDDLARPRLVVLVGGEF